MAQIKTSNDLLMVMTAVVRNNGSKASALPISLLLPCTSIWLVSCWSLLISGLRLQYCTKHFRQPRVHIREKNFHGLHTNMGRVCQQAIISYEETRIRSSIAQSWLKQTWVIYIQTKHILSWVLAVFEETSTIFYVHATLWLWY